MRDRIVAYLAQGFASSDVASMVGCSVAFVEEVAQANAQEILKEKEKIKKKKEEENIEEGYVKLETKVQRALEAQLPFAEFADLTKAMGVLIQRRQKTAAPPPGITFDNRVQTVILNVPRAALPEFTLNEKREVVAVGGRALAALPATAVRDLFSKLDNAKSARVSETLPPLPSAHTPVLEVEDAEEVVLGEVPNDF